MYFGFSEKIWLYREPVDFRKQIDGLVHLIADELQANPASGQLFIFRNKSGGKIKLLWWELNGFWLMYKRLEKGRFKFPITGNRVWILSKNELSWLLTGLDFSRQKKPIKVTATQFI